MSDTRTIQQMTDDAVAKLVADAQAAHRQTEPTAEQRLRFRDLLTEEALLHGVRPHAVRHVLRDAESVFELKDGALAPKNGATDPADPLVALSPRAWLTALAQSDPYLFTAPGRAH